MAASTEAQSPTIEELLIHHSLQRKDLDKKCPRRIRNEIALKITKWKAIGRLLNIPEEKLAAIELDKKDEEERRVATIETWHERNAHRATSLQLVEAICDLKNVAVAGVLCEMISTKNSTITSFQSEQQFPESEQQLLRAGSRELFRFSRTSNKGVTTIKKSGYECDFTADPLYCKCCNQYLREPHTVSCCKETLCEHCITQTESCPMCGQNFEYYLYSEFNDVLLDVKVHCTNSRCQWEGELRTHDDHINPSPHKKPWLEGCEWVEIKCIFCEEETCTRPEYMSRFKNSLLNESIIDVIPCSAEVSAKWKAIGLELEVGERMHGDPKQCFRSILKNWIKSRYPRTPTWTELLSALRKPGVNLHHLPQVIEQAFVCKNATTVSERKLNSGTQSISDKIEDLKFEKHVQLELYDLNHPVLSVVHKNFFTAGVRRFVKDYSPTAFDRTLGVVRSWSPGVKTERERIEEKYSSMIAKCSRYV